MARVKVGDKVHTWGGDTYIIMEINTTLSFPILGVDSRGNWESWRLDGRWGKYPHNSIRDLILPDRSLWEKLVDWVNRR